MGDSNNNNNTTGRAVEPVVDASVQTETATTKQETATEGGGLSSYLGLNAPAPKSTSDSHENGGTTPPPPPPQRESTPTLNQQDKEHTQQVKEQADKDARTASVISSPKVKDATLQLPESKPERKLSFYEKFEKEFGEKPMSKEELEAQAKRRKRTAIFSAIGDGISALSNLYFASKGAPNMYDAKNSVLPRLKAQWDQEDERQRTLREKYTAGAMQAMKMDDENEKYERDWKHTIDREAVADKRADDQYKFQQGEAARKQANWAAEQQFKKDESDRNQQNLDRQHEEGVRQFNERNKNDKARIGLERQRVGLERQRLSYDITKDDVKFTTGNKEITVKKQRLNTQTVSYVFNKLPLAERQKYMKPIMQYGVPVSGQYEPPTRDAMLQAIGEHASDPEVGKALTEISGDYGKGRGY